eukprot:996084-Alexandrium_andersonii.AAC.1
MSASLVGSEMCIRDSASTDACSMIAHITNGSKVDAATTIASTTLASTHPVSYTHLTLPTICSV